MPLWLLQVAWNADVRNTTTICEMPDRTRRIEAPSAARWACQPRAAWAAAGVSAAPPECPLGTAGGAATAATSESAGSCASRTCGRGGYGPLVYLILSSASPANCSELYLLRHRAASGGGAAPAPQANEHAYWNSGSLIAAMQLPSGFCVGSRWNCTTMVVGQGLELNRNAPCPVAGKRNW
jgi:hypothetical protein